ncbi:MAG: ATP-dependent Clp protease adaptor ClpS [Rhodospirillaceae bacterium]|nr:ATP-dependent Clp protease adaptor ClpS [Rhodospirillaceae bacterium]
MRRDVSKPAPSTVPQVGPNAPAEFRMKKPPLYKVLLHNDDYTTMQFVIEVLEQVFAKSPAEAFRIMMHVHTRGHGVCGMARRSQHSTLATPTFMIVTFATVYVVRHLLGN